MFYIPVPIRLKVLLLSIFSVLLLGFFFYYEYRNVQQDLLNAQGIKSTVKRIAILSQHIHPLQKERGLTGGYLVKQDKILFQELTAQRQATDISLKEHLDSLAQQDRESIRKFSDMLKNIRTQVDNHHADWQAVKEFYTSEIERTLDQISLELSRMEHSEAIIQELYGMLNLAIARENLGLVRANMSRSYQRGEVARPELLDISLRYGGFIHSYNEFHLHMQDESWQDWKVLIENDVLESVKKQVEAILEGKTTKLEGSTLTWWREATMVIDSMKKVEMEVINQIKTYADQSLDESRQHLFEYSLISLILFLTVVLLTVSTVVRILRALSVLIKSMEEIESTHDFGLRIQTTSNDEFGKLSLSINQLLSYTDTIIKEKDTLASVDLLTGVMNRRSFMKAADREVQRSKRYETPLSIIFCDIDKFKSINDTYGHATGDDVLKNFANTIHGHLRQSDYFARWGGEEFIVLATETNEIQTIELAEKLRELVMTISTGPVKEITCSFGAAQMKSTETFEELCERADKAVYQAKNTGRNKVCSAS